MFVRRIDPTHEDEIPPTYSQSVVFNKLFSAPAETGVGDATELLVIDAKLDMRGMIIKNYTSNGTLDEGFRYTLTNDLFWKSMRSGTLIVIRNSTGSTSADVSVGGADFNLDLNINDIKYFTKNTTSGAVFQVGPGRDFWLLKAAFSGFDGVNEAIHAFYGGASIASGSAFSTITTPKFFAKPAWVKPELSADPNYDNSGIVMGVANPNSTLADFNNPTENNLLRVRGYGSTYPLGQANTVSNQTYIDALRATALPVSLLNFNGKYIKNSVELNWTTISENNNSHFEILRSANGKDFNILKNIKGAGNSAKNNYYLVVDANPLINTSYYRLKQFDFDGKEETLKTIAVNAPEKGLEMVVHTLSKNRSITCFIQSPLSQQAKISVFDLNGKLLKAINIFLQKGQNEQIIPFNNEATGIHIIQLDTGSKNIISKQIL